MPHDSSAQVGSPYARTVRQLPRPGLDKGETLCQLRQFLRWIYGLYFSLHCFSRFQQRCILAGFPGGSSLVQGSISDAQAGVGGESVQGGDVSVSQVFIRAASLSVHFLPQPLLQPFTSGRDCTGKVRR